MFRSGRSDIAIRPQTPADEESVKEFEASTGDDPRWEDEHTEIPEDPRSRLLAFLDDHLIGRCLGRFLTPKIYYISDIGALPDSSTDTDTMGLAFAGYLNESFAGEGISILSWDRTKNAKTNSWLEQSGFVVQKRKLFVEKDLTNYKSPYPDPFIYRSLVDVGEEIFLSVLTECSIEDPFEEGQDRDPRREFDELIDYAGEMYRPDWWRLAYLEDQVAGIVLPQAFGNHEGTLFYVGVKPGCRRKGYGRVLHAGGLEYLSKQGIKGYKGSTDMRNTGMISIFQSNECGQKGIQLFYTPGAGTS